MIAIALVVGYLAGNVFPYAKTAQPSTTGQTGQTGTGTISSLSIPSFAPYRGQASAKINVVEFGDYQCPFCERFFTQTEPQLLQNYVNTGKVKFYFLDFAFLGPDSQTLGQGAWCANDQGKYYDYHDYIYSHQQQENSGWANATQVIAMAGNINGLSIQQFSSCLTSGTYQSRVQQNTQLGQSSQVTGTPSILIGNNQIGYTLVVGAQPYSSFQQAIDTQLTKA
jgi:protein-disulfide isomerase